MLFRPIAGAPAVSLLNQVGEPIKKKYNAVLGWSNGPFGLTFSTLYRGGYTNSFLTPPGDIASWTTSNLQLTFRTDSLSQNAALANTTVSLSIQNLTNKRPPFVLFPSSFGLGPGPQFDGTNADPYGRIISVQINKKWL
jgi:outer membrane receptor protein involved in Fe transport